MAKIPSFDQKIFGSGAGGSQISVFGSLFAGSPTFTTDAPTAQSLSNWLTGWLGAAIGGNAPAIEDMNALFFVVTTQLAYLKQAGVAEWDAVTPYYIGSFVNSAGYMYVSLTDANVNNAVTNTTHWKRFGSTITTSPGDITATLADEMIEVDSSITNSIVTLPASGSTGCKGKKLTITKMDSTVNQVKVTDGTYTSYLLGQYDSVTVFSNGTVWYAI